MTSDGLSDRTKLSCSKQTVVPIDQDSGAYTAILPPQQDNIYEKHILHNLMLKMIHQQRQRFVHFSRVHDTYSVLSDCLKPYLQFHCTTQYEHIVQIQ